MDDFETELRDGLDRYAQTMRVSRPPVDELLRQLPAPRPVRSRAVVAGVGLAVGAAAVVGVVVGRATDGEDSQRAATAPACSPQPAEDGVVGSGEVRDGRRWEVRVGGEPPHVVTVSRIDNHQIGGGLHDDLSWGPLVNQGLLGWHIEVFDRGQVVEGAVPTTTTAVQIRQADGERAFLCPVHVPGIDAVTFAAGYLPSRADIVSIAALDASGRRLAYVDVAALRDRAPDAGYEPGEDYGLGFQLEVDPERVGLPLGGREWPG